MNIYVGTYGKYNSGSIAGEWIDPADYDSKEDFLEYCAELHEDEEDPEFMFQDWEGIPDALIGESWISEMLWDERVIEIIQSDEDDLLHEWNEYQSEINGDGFIYENDEHFFQEYFGSNIMEAVRAVVNGDYSLGHDYVWFDGYANLESFRYLSDKIDKDEMIRHIISERV